MKFLLHGVDHAPSLSSLKFFSPVGGNRGCLLCDCVVLTEEPSIGKVVFLEGSARRRSSPGPRGLVLLCWQLLRYGQAYFRLLPYSFSTDV